MWGRLAACGGLVTRLSERPIANRPQAASLPHMMLHAFRLCHRSMISRHAPTVIALSAALKLGNS